MSIRKYRDLLLNPRPAFKSIPPPTQVFMRIFTAIRRRFLVILLLTIMTLVIIGMLIPKGTYSIYEDFGITDATNQPSGIFWDILWFIRGQPAGWQKPKATGLFAVQKTVALPDMVGQGFNGPLSPVGLLTEFIVDFVFYMPKFFNPGWVAVNLDLVPPMMIKMVIDVCAMGLFILIIVPLFGVLMFFSPLILMRLWDISGPLSKILILVGFLLFIYLLFMGYLNPLFEGLIELLGGTQ
jgi:hypothetical protein